MTDDFLTNRAERRHQQARRLASRRHIRARQLERELSGETQGSVLAAVAGGDPVAGLDLRGRLATGFQRLLAASGELGRSLGLERGRQLGQVAEPGLGAAWSPDKASLLGLVSRALELPPATAILGTAGDGRPIVMEFGQQQVTNVLITGATGAGKSSLLSAIGVSLALNNRQSVLQLMILDGSRSGDHHTLSPLQPLEFLPHALSPVIHGPEPVLEALSFLAGELTHRVAREQCTPVVVILFDNLDQLPGSYSARVSECIAQLAQHGPQAGFHLVTTARDAGGPIFDELMKANLPLRLVGRAADARAAKLASGIPNSGAEQLDAPGQFLAVMDGGPAVYFRAARLSGEELDRILERLYRSRPRPLLALAARPPEPARAKNGSATNKLPVERRPQIERGEPTATDEPEGELAP